MTAVTEYVAGFLFSNQGGEVALVRKARPQWQAGRLNGVGGHIEPGETAYDAMVREFHEEAGVNLIGWRHFATVCGDWGSVAFFRAFGTVTLHNVRTLTDEPIEIHDTSTVLSGQECLPNLKWLIPLALYRHDKYLPVVATEAAS